MNNKFKTGFLKRAQEYGYSPKDADSILKKADLSSTFSHWAGEQMGKTGPWQESGDPEDAAHKLLSSAGNVGMLGGGALGAGIGALTGIQKDQKGQSHKLRNALYGAALGGAAGNVGAGYLGNLGSDAIMNNKEDFANGAGVPTPHYEGWWKHLHDNTPKQNFGDFIRSSVYRGYMPSSPYK